MRGITLICVVAICALAVLPILPTYSSEALECVSKEPCPEGEHCVQFAGGDYNNLRECQKAVGLDESCGHNGYLGIYLQYPPCEKPYECKLEGGYNGVSDVQSVWLIRRGVTGSCVSWEDFVESSY